MSTRITLRIGNTTPDDLEIQRFLRVLGRKNLSRQGWIKHAMILGFAQLEKELESTEPISGGASGAQKSKKQRPLAGSQPAAAETEGPSASPLIVQPVSSTTQTASTVMPQPPHGDTESGSARNSASRQSAYPRHWPHPES